MRRRHCRRMPRRARLLRKHLSEFTSWSQLLKKSGFPRIRRKWQVYKPVIELSTSNKTGKPEQTVEIRGEGCRNCTTGLPEYRRMNPQHKRHPSSKPAGQPDSPVDEECPAFL